LGYVMEWIYKLIPNYGWDIILFTLLITAIKIPLQLNQQKSMARMSAFQPMVAEIQKKYRDKPEKQQEELMKLQEQGYKPTAGCMPMLVNFLVMFGVIEVVYRPLQRIFHIGADALTAAGEALTAMGISFTTVTRDTNIIAQVIAGESTVSSCFTPDQVATITEFGQHMDFFGIDLTRVPQYSLAAENLPLLILPVLAIVTMFLSTHISMKASGQEMQGSMKLTMYMMPLMYLFFCFTYPLAFSLYYVISNIVMTVQTQVMRKVYDPDKMRKEIEAQIAEKKKQEKRGVKNTTVKVTDPKTGKTTEKNLSASEMNKRRLEYARQLDEERYKDERTVPLSELNKQDKE
jgi:YidC/Oxa1 family membrane protein insertase